MKHQSCKLEETSIYIVVNLDTEVHGVLDFEGLGEAKELLKTPKRRRLEAGLDVMLTAQGPTPEKRKERAARRIERLSERREGVKAGILKMRALEAEGYDARQIALQVIAPHVGRRVSAKALSKKMSVSEKTRRRLKFSLAKRKSKAKAKAEATSKTEAKAKNNAEAKVKAKPSGGPTRSAPDTIRMVGLLGS